MSRTPTFSTSAPQYSIYSVSGMEPLDTLELHVLARAYRAAWRAMYARDPEDRHVIASLEVMIVFGSPSDPRPSPSPMRELERARDPLPVDWESLGEPDEDPQ